jgi:hypothetical protein
VSLITYEDRLDRDLDWALREGSMHFEDKSAVHQTLRAIAKRLDELGIPYAVAGGMAMYFHGYRRFTEDVDILVTRESVKKIHEQLEGRGYLPLFAGSKNLRNTITGVRIEFIISGDYPGDGKPKPVMFPDPVGATHEIDGIKFLNLQQLVELKLASGMTNTARMKDLADVQELIKELALSEEFADQLDPYVRDKYRELWTAVHDNPDPE